MKCISVRLLIHKFWETQEYVELYGESEAQYILVLDEWLTLLVRFLHEYIDYEKGKENNLIEKI